MDYLLLFAIVLFVFLSFGFKEGYYSDTNTSAAATSMNTLTVKLNTLQSTLVNLTTHDLSLDAQAKLNPLLHPDTDSTYASGVVQHAQNLSNRISDYQNNLIILQSSIDGINNIQVNFKDGNLNLSDAITKMVVDAKDITKQLNQIPDS
jgi:hypothetical protein